MICICVSCALSFKVFSSVFEMCFNFGAFFLRFLFQSYCLFFFLNFKFVQVLVRVLCDFLVLLISLILVCIPVILNCV